MTADLRDKFKQASVSGKVRLQSFPWGEEEEEGAEAKKKEEILKLSDEIHPQKTVSLRAKFFLAKSVGREGSVQH